MQKKLLPILILCLLLLSGCGKTLFSAPFETADPYAGMVQAESGYGTKIWVKQYEDVPVNPLRELRLEDETEIVDLQPSDNRTMAGIDVSKWQGEIDWKRVAQDGVEFAIIRCGYRGSKTGALVVDPYFVQNIAGAKEAGLKVPAPVFPAKINPLSFAFFNSISFN